MSLNVLPAFALLQAPELMTALRSVVDLAPYRHMLTPGGFAMSVASSNCGQFGWISDRAGYRYVNRDPSTGNAWPPMPAAFARTASLAAAASGFTGFEPDACLINRYVPGSRLSLHQDKDEQDFAAPIVTVSLGMTATFLFGGLARSAKAARIALAHGDVVVFGAAQRLSYHGVLPLKDAPHPLLGRERVSLTFRKSQ